MSREDDYQIPGASAWPFEKRCPECGKVFSGTMQEIWIYRDRGEMLCSWGCQRKREKKREAEEAARKRKIAGRMLTPAQKECIIRRLVNRGMSNDEISEETGFSRQQVNYYRRKVLNEEG